MSEKLPTGTGLHDVLPSPAEPWDSAKHMAPDPSWPIERRLKWHQVCGHILLLNCSELVRHKAAAAADRELERHPQAAREPLARPTTDGRMAVMLADELRARPQLAPGTPGRPTTSLEEAMLANIDGLNGLIRGMLQAFPDTADEQEWRDRAGELGVCDPDGLPYRAITEADL